MVRTVPSSDQVQSPVVPPIFAPINSYLIEFSSNTSQIQFEICEDNLKEEIKNVLMTLQEREQEVLELRFGLIDGTCHTLEEVGKDLNVTRERVLSSNTDKVNLCNLASLSFKLGLPYISYDIMMVHKERMALA